MARGHCASHHLHGLQAGPAAPPPSHPAYPNPADTELFRAILEHLEHAGPGRNKDDRLRSWDCCSGKLKVSQSNVPFCPEAHNGQKDLGSNPSSTFLTCMT